MSLRSFESIDPETGLILEFGVDPATRLDEARTRAALLQTRVIERVPGKLYLSRSRRTGATYVLQRIPDGWRCTCDGYTYTNICHHLGAVSLRATMERWDFGQVARRIVIEDASTRYDEQTRHGLSLLRGEDS